MKQNQSGIERVSMTYQPNNNSAMRRQSPSFSEPSQFRNDEI